MRTVIWAAAIIAVSAVGCDRRDSGDGLLRDPDGNAYVLRDMLDGRQWMSDNLNLARPDSYCYGGSASACFRFGRLYTWASAAEACRLLGAGWRLPTDDEWRQMAKVYGGVRGDSDDDGRAAYSALLRGGVSGFNALLGGGREPDGNYARVEDHGFYWTATEYDMEHAWFYNFGRGAGLLNRHSGGDKSMALAVRCVNAS
jgi:uncharacterized protein (TIGR02145 family)